MAYDKINRYGYKEPTFLGSILAAVTYAAIFTILNLSIAVFIFHIL